MNSFGEETVRWLRLNPSAPYCGDVKEGFQRRGTMIPRDASLSEGCAPVELPDYIHVYVYTYMQLTGAISQRCVHRRIVQCAMKCAPF